MVPSPDNPDTSENPVREVERILRRGIGLDVQSVGSSMVAIAIQNRRKKRKVGSDREYANLLSSSPTEFQALVEEIVVPETWFFRDRESYAFLEQWARCWLPAHPYHAMRVLSAPCASGEEPYSIVMTMVRAGISPDRFSVEAIDVSAVSLEKARKAVFGRNSFRGQPLDFREEFFEKVPEGWHLSEGVAKQVHFRQVNMVEAGVDRKDGELDVIFCRNLLIYFDDESRSKVMTLFKRILAPDGVLFLGHAEGALAHEFGFESIPAPMAFAFRRATKHATPSGMARRPRPLKTQTSARVAPLWSLSPPKPDLAPVEPARRKAPAVAAKVEATVPASPQEIVARAQRLADEGHFAEARAACQAALQADGQCARAYYLLALIEEAAGDEHRAEEYYKKTLYIEPDHEEALVQLALLLEKQGMTEAARRLQERARRVRARKDKTR